MTEQWHYRKAHSRRKLTGGTASVRGGWVFRGKSGSKGVTAPGRSCPVCGSPVVSAKMPNGRVVHFEGRKGLARVKHPCLHLGEGLGKRRDKDTPDLFEALESFLK